MLYYSRTIKTQPGKWIIKPIVECMFNALIYLCNLCHQHHLEDPHFQVVQAVLVVLVLVVLDQQDL